MRRIIAGTLALTVLSSTWLLGAEGATKAKKAAVKKAPPPASAQMQQMQDQLNQQQQQINQLQQQLQQSNQQLQSTQSQLQSSVQQANQQAAAAQASASAAQQSANSLNSSVVDLKASTTTITQSLTVVQKDVKELLNPLAIRYKGVTFTPVGDMDLGYTWRNHNNNTSASTPFGNIPLSGEVNNYFSETRMEARNSRVGFRMVGNPNDNVKLTGFVLTDFFGASEAGTNPGQVNSWLLRIREAWMMAEFKSGFSFVGGQFYSLWTPGRRGTLPGGEMVPGFAYEGNEIVGFPYERGAQLRLAKKFNKNFSAAFEIDQPELTAVSSAYTPSALGGMENTATSFPAGSNEAIPCCNQSFYIYTLTAPGSTTATGAQVANGVLTATSASTNAAPIAALQSENAGLAANPIPDIVAKVAWDATNSTAHFEVRGIARFFRSGELLNVNGAMINGAGTGQTGLAATNALQGYTNATAVAIATTPQSAATVNAVAATLGKVDMNTAKAWGIGISGVVPIVKNKVDFILTADAGAGVGSRYNPGGTNNTGDATVKLDSSGTYVLQPVKSAALAGGFEFHPTPKWEWYVYGGNEYYQRVNYTDTSSATTNTLSAALIPSGANVCGNGKQMCLGYGNSNLTSLTSQSSANRDIWEGTLGYLYRLWTGNYGTLQTYGEIQYIHRAVWQTAFAGPEPLKGQEIVVDLALRYVLP